MAARKTLPRAESVEALGRRGSNRGVRRANLGGSVGIPCWHESPAIGAEVPERSGHWTQAAVPHPALSASFSRDGTKRRDLGRHRGRLRLLRPGPSDSRFSGICRGDAARVAEATGRADGVFYAEESAVAFF